MKYRVNVWCSDFMADFLDGFSGTTGNVLNKDGEVIEFDKIEDAETAGELAVDGTPWSYTIIGRREGA